MVRKSSRFHQFFPIYLIYLGFFSVACCVLYDMGNFTTLAVECYRTIAKRAGGNA